MESKDIRSIQEAYSLICETASPQRTPSGGTVSQKTQRDPNTRATAPTSASDHLGKLNKKNFPAPKPLEELAMPRSREFEKRLPTPTPPRSREFEQRLPKPAPPRSREFEKRLPAPTLKNSADLFDIVKGHLIDEGFAETEESAIAIMANMSEEWRDSILEFWGPQTTTPKNSPTGTKSVKVGEKYPARQNGRPVDVTYGADGSKKITPMNPIKAGGMQYKYGSTWGMNKEEVDSQGNRSHDLFTGNPNPNYNSGNGKPKPKPQVKKEPRMRDNPLW